ncbi:hypothetical protein FA15DRAFT_666617 [Coprinopsis marcescibilis]|uniref:Autophagy-related protein 17 n=1 Tax=Coprinopsis marcescibilis TaxID=230819 RepID=A0A5C3LF47_COPMA|nr:hypothetical protein FA15DRAFT_666617 [Coprinopsis marcescibilis]
MALPSSDSPEQPHLVSLVLQSKKALHHGEQVCSRAHARYNASAQEAIEVLALDAKVRWISDAILEQLKLAASVAKSIEEKRAALDRRVQAWDGDRNKSTDALESVLDSLGRRVVPPDFHETLSDSSLFGSQHSDDEDERIPSKASTEKVDRVENITLNRLSISPVSPSATIRRGVYAPLDSAKGKQKAQSLELKKSEKEDRRKWKTLRDFVDDRAIEDVLENIDNERNRLEGIINQTHGYPSSLRRTIENLRESLPGVPEVSALTRMQEAVVVQDNIVASMAEKLESLAGHYDQMAGALKDSEAGEGFSEEDLQAMNRDTEELPIIMGELDEAEKQIDGSYESLAIFRRSSQQDLELLSGVLNDLDELGEIMGEMLNTQDSVETQFEEALVSLSSQLETVDHLHRRYVLYQTAFNSLLLEISRRDLYKSSVEKYVQTMQRQLQEMVEEENQVRKHFNAEYGAHLPEDICLCIANEPTRWNILPESDEALEVLPAIAKDLLAQAEEHLNADKIPVGPESL